MTDAQKKEIIPVDWKNKLREKLFISGIDGVMDTVEDWFIRLGIIKEDEK